MRYYYKKEKKHPKNGVDGAFSWRCCYASRKYLLDFSNVADPCIPKKKKHRPCGC